MSPGKIPSCLQLPLQLGQPVEDRKDLVGLDWGYRKIHPDHAEFAITFQLIRIFGSAAQGHRQGARVAAGLLGHLAKARQKVERITVARAAGDREPAVAIADRAACRPWEGAADEDRRA